MKMHNKDEDCVMQVNDCFAWIKICIKDEEIIIEIKTALSLVILILKQILIQLMNRVYNGRVCKILIQKRREIHNCKPMNLKTKQIA